MEKCRRMKRLQCMSKNWIFLTMKVLENTPAVLSLGKLCDENGYPYEWIKGQKHLVKDGIRIICNTENFVPIVVPGLSTSSSARSHPSTSRTLTRQVSHCSTSSSSSSSSPTVISSGNGTRESEDRIECDTSPVLVSTCVDVRTVQPVVDQANKIPETNKKGNQDRTGNPLCSDIPEWLQELWENLVDDEIPLQGGSHASSSHEVSVELTLKRREDLGKQCLYSFHQRAPCRRRNGAAVPRADNFGDLTTADHKVLSENCESRNIYRYAVVVLDWATQWIQSYPCNTKNFTRNPEELAKVLGAE